MIKQNDTNQKTGKMTSFVFDSETLIEFKSITTREGSTMKEHLETYMKEYIKKHGEGNPAYSLDKWSEDSEFKALPAFLESKEKWVKFVQNTDDETLKEIEDKAHQLEIIASCYIKIGSKEERKKSNFRSVREMGRYGSNF
ncbi:hypothetical protein OAU44_00210 [bacterium]|nr:hypothetical protein [bacterium]